MKGIRKPLGQIMAGSANLRNSLSSAIMVSAVFASGVGVGAAQDAATFKFSIPKGDLRSVIAAIAKASSSTVAIPADAAAGLSAGPISATETVEQALKQALAGTDLVVQSSGKGAYVIRKSGKLVAQGADRKPAVQGDVAAIDVIDISDKFNDNGFVAGNVMTGLHLGETPIRETPLAISAVTKEAIQSMVVTNPVEAAIHTAGVTENGLGQPVIRGFNPVGSHTNITNADVPMDFAERVEVLKGPTAVLGSSVGVGDSEAGVVNVVRKQATPDDVREMLVRFGGPNFEKHVAVDLGGAIPGSDGFSYRLNVSGTLSSGERRDWQRRGDDFAVMPQLQYSNGIFGFALSATYSRNDEPQRAGYYYQLLSNAGNYSLGKLLKFDPTAFAGGNALRTTTTTFTPEAKLTLDLNDLLGVNVKLEDRLSYQETTTNSYGVGIQPVLAFDPVTGFSAFGSASNMSLPVMFNKFNITYTYQNDLLKNTLNTGLDFMLAKSASSIYAGTGFHVNPLNPGSIQWDLTNAPSTQDLTDVNTSVYLNDKVDIFNNKLHLLGGGKVMFDRQRVGGVSNFCIPNFVDPSLPPMCFPIANTRTNKSRYTPWNVGAVYDLSSWASVYVNAMHSVKPQTTTLGLFPPETRDLKEAGLRFHFLDDKLNITTSVYDQNRDNVLYADPSPANPLGAYVVKGQRSRGVELEVQGQLTNNWNALLALSYVKADFSTAVSTNQSSAPMIFGIPAFSGSLWTTYTFDDTYGWLNGVSIGGGVRGVSSSKQSIPLPATATVPLQMITNPGYAMFDASVSYKKDNWTLTLKANNILDKFALYPINMPSGGGSFAEPGRNLRLEARVKF